MSLYCKRKNIIMFEFYNVLTLLVFPSYPNQIPSPFLHTNCPPRLPAQPRISLFLPSFTFPPDSVPCSSLCEGGFTQTYLHGAYTSWFKVGSRSVSSYPLSTMIFFKYKESFSLYACTHNTNK